MTPLRLIRLAAIAALLCFAAVPAACGGGDGGAFAGTELATDIAASPSAPSPPPSPEPSSPAPATPADSSRALGARELTPRQLAGQRVVFSYAGLTPPESLLRRIRAGEAAGVIFFKANIAGRDQLRRVTARLQRAAAQSPVPLPLLLMVDQEGGYVRRLAGAPEQSARQIGAAGDPIGAARRAGREAGLNLRAAGLNVNLAPVLDVYRTSGDFCDRAARSFSRDPRTVAKLGAAFIAAQHKTGVLGTAKHFPGLGAATALQNTDAREVTLRVPLRSLRAIDELPYKTVEAAGVPLVMVSWAVYPALDDRRPAGFSPVVVKQELRERLGFDGVTITDSLMTGSLTRFGWSGRRGLLAAGAGMDLLLCTGGVTRGSEVLNSLTAALRIGRLGHGSFVASADRVMRLRRSLEH